MMRKSGGRQDRGNEELTMDKPWVDVVTIPLWAVHPGEALVAAVPCDLSKLIDAWL